MPIIEIKATRGKHLRTSCGLQLQHIQSMSFLNKWVSLRNCALKTYEYLDNVDPSMWSRSYFTDHSKSDLLVNNLSESFNSYILDARDKAIVTMIEKIRRKLMRRFQLKREGMSKLTGKICSKIQAKLDNEGLKSSNCVSIYAGNGLFKVECKH